MKKNTKNIPNASTGNGIIAKGREVVRIEADAVRDLLPRIDKNFLKAVNLIARCKGRTIVTGMGKSGIIARKIVGTFNSTGTPALFLHPSDAVHGDLGTVQDDDLIVCISKSGDTAELHPLLETFKRIGVPVIAMVGTRNSQLAAAADVVLDVSVKEEACPHDLAPTASTTATLAFGDALAMALLEKRNFTPEEFAMYHPGGNLGKRLTLKVEQFMAKDDAVPVVKTSVLVRDAILEMTSKRLGATCVVNGGGTLAGILTDGDLRRMLQKGINIGEAKAGEVMTKNPKTIGRNLLASIALQEMEAHNITQLVVVDAKRRPVGVVHLHELVKAGLGSDAQ